MSSVDETKQMLIRVPKKVFSDAKICAYKRNITLREWIIRLMVDGIIRDTKYDKEE